MVFSTGKDIYRSILSVLKMRATGLSAYEWVVIDQFLTRRIHCRRAIDLEAVVYEKGSQRCLWIE